MGKIVMGYWDCPYCGAKRIKGTEKKCPYCGGSVTGKVSYYMDGPVEYLGEEESKHYGKGANWECSFCKSANSVESDTCINCGATRLESAKNYFEIHNTDSTTVAYKMGDDGKVVADDSGMQIEEAKIHSAIDEDGWVCQYCKTVNPPDRDVCSGCHAHRDGKAKKHESKSKVGVWTCAYCGGENPIGKNRCKHCHERRKVVDYKSPSASEKKTKSRKKLIITLAVVAALIIGLVLAFMPVKKTYTVTEKTWQSEIKIEDYQTRHESDWSVPEGGRLTGTKSEIHHYEKVVDHYETKTRRVSEQVLDGYDTETYYTNNGDGTFTETTRDIPRYRTEYHTETYQDPVYRDEPVYQTKYYYDIERWLYARSVIEAGNDDNPYYGELVLADNEREESREITYAMTGVEAVKEGKEIPDPVTYAIEEDVWQQIAPGVQITVKVKGGEIKSVVSVDTP